MRLERANEDHVRQLMAWFPDLRSCRAWGGPQFRHPFNAASFVEDTRVRELPSHVLLDADDRLLAFGQYYPRLGRCHFGRLVVAPEQRGKGLGRRLIRELAEIGVPQLGTDECSLFVAADNAAAIALYRKLGFVQTAYPEDDPNAAPYLYMVAPAAGLMRGAEED